MTDIRRGEGRYGADLTARERFNRTMHYQQVDYISHIEFGYWTELKQDWMAAGHLPASLRQPDGSIPDRLVEEFFGVEQFEQFDARAEALPLRQVQVIERTENTVTYRDGLGVLRQDKASGTETIPHFLEFPIRDRTSWAAFRDEFLDPDHPARQYTEAELAALEQLTRHTTNPVTTNLGSFIGRIRDWIGFEQLAYLSVDEPDLIEEMVIHLSQMRLKLFPDVLERGWFDASGGWEDIAFNSGPLLNPRFFRERIMPHMLPVTQLLRQHGIDVIWTDCDGSILKLIPLWLGVGVNCMFPLEVHPGNDPVALKGEYGRELLIRGGFDKFALWQGREAVLAELKRLEPVVAQGGFIPHVDHRCPALVSFDTYCYYIWEKCHMLGWPEERIKAFPFYRRWRELQAS
jgi:uroporphyrinogen decarboxylase